MKQPVLQQIFSIGDEPKEGFGRYLVSLSGMVKTPRLQAKQIFHCRGATCHSGESRNPGKMELRILDAESC